VVEGQAGVAKAFRIGANLVLTKPINLEQAKGTLRVARGLLRKNDVAKPASIANSAPPAPPTSKSSPQATVVSIDSELPHAPAGPSLSVPATVRSQTPANQISATSSRGAEPSLATADNTRTSEIEKPVAIQASVQIITSLPEPKTKTEAAGSRTSFGIGAASAPAPAREPQSDAPTGNKSPVSVPETNVTAKGEPLKDLKKSTNSAESSSAPAPTFTFGGTVSTETGSASGSKKWLLAIAAALVLITAGGYFAWTHWGQSSTNSSLPDRAVDSPVKATAPIPRATPALTTSSSDKTSAPDTLVSANTESIETHPSKITSEVDSSKPSASAPSKSAKEKEEPIVLKNSRSRTAAKSVDYDGPAPPMLSSIAPAGNGARLPNLMESHSKAPAPILQALNVSQGVSQGLLVKKVQPKYPPGALRAHIEGSVQMMATISRNGDISAVKILSGDRELAHAAADAVKQWKYKPYLLNGSPVEIQTQITVNFKVPN
jgi:protein TonB